VNKIDSRQKPADSIFTLGPFFIDHAHGKTGSCGIHLEIVARENRRINDSTPSGRVSPGVTAAASARSIMRDSSGKLTIVPGLALSTATSSSSPDCRILCSSPSNSGASPDQALENRCGIRQSGCRNREYQPDAPNGFW
jgi:hypothetical protein